MGPKKNIPAVGKLFRLVATLTPVQKRAFKRDARFWSDSENAPRYVALFDAVNRHLAKGGGEHTVLDNLLLLPGNYSRSELSTFASYLYSRILGSMRFVPDHSLRFNNLNAFMQDVSFLYNKALYADCLPVLKEALDLAKKIDRPAYILELSLIERRIVTTLNVRNQAELLQKIQEREIEAIRQIRWFTRFSDLASLISNYFARQTMVPLEIDKQVKRALGHFLPNQEEILQPRARYFLLRIGTLYHSLLAATDLKNTQLHAETAIQFQERVVELYEKFLPLKEEEYATYVNMVDTLLQMMAQQGATDGFEERLAQIEQTQDDLLRYRTAAFLRMQMLNGRGDYKTLVDYCEHNEIALHLRRLQGQIWPSRVLNMWFLGIEAYFILGDYGKMSVWCEEFLKDSRNDLLPDVKVLANVLPAIAEYHTPNAHRDGPGRLLDNIVRNFQLRKKGNPRNVFLYQLLRTLKKAFEMQHNTSVRNGVREQLEVLNREIRNTPNFAHYSLPLVWMYAQLNKTSVLEEMENWRKQISAQQ